MLTPRFLRNAPLRWLTGVLVGMGPAAGAQTLDDVPLPSRAVAVLLPDAPPRLPRARFSANPWQVERPTGWYVNRLPVPRTLNSPYRGRCCWTADELLAQIPAGHIRRVQRLRPAALLATEGPGRAEADGAWFIQVCGERQLLQALRRDGSVRLPRRKN